MVKILLVFGMLILSIGNEALAQKKVSISGKIQFLNPDNLAKNNKVWIGHREGGEFKVLDSVEVKSDGLWQFKVDATKPAFYDVEIVKWDRATVWADANLVLNCRGYDTGKVKRRTPRFIFIEGSEDNNLINLIEHTYFMHFQKMVAVSQEQNIASQAKDTTWTGYLTRTEIMKKLSDDYKERIKVIVRSYQDRPVVLYGLRRMSWERDNDFILPILENLTKKYPGFTEVEDYKKEAANKLTKASKVMAGMPVPSISYNDPEGKPVAIESYKGKVLLLDFWASWCGPCRASIPKVKQLYEKYGPSGFDVLSISIDDNEKAWRKAMADEKMPWKQVLSPNKKETMSAFLFSIIPSLYLIDKEGKIVKFYAGFTEELEKKLKEIFENK